LPEANPCPAHERQGVTNWSELIHEPQAVTAARYVLRGEDPPETVFLPEVLGFPHAWEGLIHSLRRPNKERHPEIILPDTNGVGCDDLLSYDECPPQLRRWAIEEALREAFSILQWISGREPDIANLNLNTALTLACFGEIEALVKEWDELGANNV
jgi:hypothetical protein